MWDFEAARTRMVDNQLRTSNVTDHRILTAVGEVPRELFVPHGRRALAYSDVDHALGGGRYLAAPAPFAKLLQLAEIDHTDKVLDVGSGTGYGAAVLGRLGASVVALEPVADLAAKARANLTEVGATNVSVDSGALDGSSLRQTFDVIFVEGALRREPTELFPLLADAGRLVALVGTGGAAVAYVFVRSGDDVAGREEFNTSLPPLNVAPAVETFEF